MDSIPLPRFYVYTLARPDGTIFYVGKGQGRRIQRHEQFARLGYSGHRYNLIRQIWRQGGQVQKQIVFRTDDEDVALAHEVALIASFPAGQLVNLTAGGDGVRGYQWTAEARAKVSAAGKGRKPTPEANQHVSEALKGHTHSAETRAKIGAAQRAHLQTPEGQAQQQARINAARTPEARAKLSETRRAQRKPPAPKSPSPRAPRQLTPAPPPLPKQPRVVSMAARARIAAAQRELSLDQVTEIRARLADGESRAAVARAMGLKYCTVRHIADGTTYRDY